MLRRRRLDRGVWVVGDRGGWETVEDGRVVLFIKPKKIQPLSPPSPFPLLSLFKSEPALFQMTVK